MLKKILNSQLFIRVVLPIVFIAFIFTSWLSWLQYDSYNNRLEVTFDEFVQQVEGGIVERKILSDDFYTEFDNQENLEIILNLSREKQLDIKKLQLSPSGENAFVDIYFNNNEEKKAVVYLEKGSDWYWKGYYWKVYRVEIFDIGIITEVQDQTQEFLNNFWSSLEDFITTSDTE